MSETVIYVITVPLLIAFFGLGVWIMRQGIGADGSAPQRRRLTLIDTVPVDSRRKLILIRRDDVEHLVMTGGPVDVVVETGISPHARLPQSLKDILGRGQNGLEEPTLLTDEVPLILRHEHPN